MTLKPEWDEEIGLVTKRSYVQTHSALTEYKVLDNSSKAALVELQPITGRYIFSIFKVYVLKF